MANPVLPLLFLAAATPFAAVADSPPTDSSSSSYSFGSDDPSIAVLVVVLVLAFFLMGFISICIRHRSDSTSDNDDSRRFVVATSLWRSPDSNGMDPSVIESFPLFSYSEVNDRWISLECAVCINEFVDGEMLRKLPKCNHVFHPDCIDAWLGCHTSCPVCRMDQSPDDLDESIESSRLQNQVSITVNCDENEMERNRIVKFSRSNSTGHTLNLPEEIGVQLKRTKSCGEILPVVNGDRSGEVEKSRRWVFNVVYKTGSIQDVDSPV
ncbi:E3 ubiquitin-protein ligase ATL6-like [Impatiens glandulifera]|uniref:E3 ubiquitin-protein ligase ATL6-like n=1 Tax=Impatiens glandulifera TaxID=253017 RepID=UPI001FB12B27|nr:E3 ubiquitin-protein ligase ATL6-like [Impatiens glandulifera]